jgi:ABC-type uncharacterized transport system fused permease/ATPase subunit
MDKQFEDLMRKRVEIDRLNTEKESLERWHRELSQGVKQKSTLADLRVYLDGVIKTMETRLQFLEKERRRLT